VGLGEWERIDGRVGGTVASRAEAARRGFVHLSAALTASLFGGPSPSTDEKKPIGATLDKERRGEAKRSTVLVIGSLNSLFL
jgi:hypothetical protein